MSAPGTSHALSARLGRRAGCALLVVGGAALFAIANWPRSEPKPTTPPVAAPERYPNPYKGPAPPDVTLLLDGLVRGANLDGGFSVRGISAPEEKRVIIDVERGDVGFRVWLMRKGADTRRAPASSEHFSLYVVQPRPSAEAVSDDMKKAVLGDLKRRLIKTETQVRVPVGL